MSIKPINPITPPPSNLPPEPPVDFRVYSLLGAISDTASIMSLLLTDTQNNITAMMQEINNLIAPLSSKWTQYYQGVLQNDASKINSGDPSTQANFNIDNTTATSANTAFGNLSSTVSQQVTNLTTNYSNQQQLIQTLSIALWQSVSQFWVI